MPSASYYGGAVLRRTRDYLFHRAHRLEAQAIRRSIESWRGKTASADIRRCREYALDILGHAHFAPWLEVYAAMAGRFIEGWIPDNFYGSVVVPKLKGGYGKICDLKSLNSVLFRDDAFPDILARVNGIFLDTRYELVPPPSVEDRLFAQSDRVIFKRDNWQRGSGIHFFDKDSFDLERVSKLGNGLFQRVIEQHELLAAFARSSVATLRLTSVYEDDGRVSIRACYLRFGTGADTHVQSSSHVRVPIRLTDGAFGHKGYTIHWQPIDRHPTSGVAFAGHRVPAFEECMSTVTALHRKVPYARCVGWDVTVDKGGKVMLMEWNAVHNDIKFSEGTQGPCFADLGWEKLGPARRTRLR